MSDASNYETRKRLGAALNEILTYAGEHLPVDWEIRITAVGGPGNGEAWMDLIDPDGNHVSKDWSYHQRTVFGMVKYAKENQADEPDGDGPPRAGKGGAS